MGKVASRFVAVMVLGAAVVGLSSCGGARRFSADGKWLVESRPERLGYSSEKLAAAIKYSENIDTAAVVVVVDGRILCQWGAVDKKFNTHSIRKSFLSAMYGRYVADGVIDLDATMAELGIDDEPALSQQEKKATVRDCLKARSGIYHAALYESQGMKDLRPVRHTMKAGTHWYYNNWDFNAAGTIFEKLAGKKIFEAMELEIAVPIGMQDFSAGDGTYVTGDDSIHCAYPFRITARDMARFGLLMLDGGRWNGRQIVPSQWVAESTRYHSDAALYGSDGYGYMWWVTKDDNKFSHLPNVDLPQGTYSARGAGGHYILIIPARNMVIVHRVNTDIKGNGVSKGQFGKLVRLILEAKDD